MTRGLVVLSAAGGRKDLSARQQRKGRERRAASVQVEEQEMGRCLLLSKVSPPQKKQRSSRALGLHLGQKRQLHQDGREEAPEALRGSPLTSVQLTQRLVRGLEQSLLQGQHQEGAQCHLRFVPIHHGKSAATHKVQSRELLPCFRVGGGGRELQSHVTKDMVPRR